MAPHGAALAVAAPPVRPGLSSSSNVRLYELALGAPIGALEHTRHWRPLDRLVACENLRREFDNSIAKPLRYANTHYAALCPRRLHIVCGAAGSGKRTFVRAYCKHAQVNLVEVTTRCGQLAAADLESAYELAARYAPALVLVHDADAFLLAEATPDGEPRNERTEAMLDARRTLASLLDVSQSERRAWTVLSVEASYARVTPEIRARARHMCWLAPPSYLSEDDVEDVPSDNFMSMRTLIVRMLHERTQTIDAFEGGMVAQNGLTYLIVAAINSTPAHVASYLDRVFERPLARETLDSMEMLTPEHALPAWNDFLACLYQQPTIGNMISYSIVQTPQDAVVTAPYHTLECRAGLC